MRGFVKQGDISPVQHGFTALRQARRFGLVQIHDQRQCSARRGRGVQEADAARLDQAGDCGGGPRR